MVSVSSALSKTVTTVRRMISMTVWSVLRMGNSMEALASVQKKIISIASTESASYVKYRDAELAKLAIPSLVLSA